MERSIGKMLHEFLIWMNLFDASDRSKLVAADADFLGVAVSPAEAHGDATNSTESIWSDNVAWDAIVWLNWEIKEKQKSN